MDSITIITIVVVALLTVVIFGLTWLAYGSCIKAYKMEVGQGKHDEQIKEEYTNKKKKKLGGALGLIGSGIILSALLAVFVTGVVYKARGENFAINNQVALVIKTGSMSDFYDEDTAAYYNHDTRLQFGVGDICLFDKVSSEDELVEGEVYGYKQKNIIITHRLIEIREDGCKFKGDNNPVSDGYIVSKDNIIYHYTGNKIPAIGSFILYAQSYFGLWSLVGIVGVTVSSEVVYGIINRINKERVITLTTPITPEPEKRRIRAQFKRRDGSEVIIYEKRGEHNEN